MIRIYSVLKQGVNGVIAFFKSDTEKLTADNNIITSDID